MDINAISQVNLAPNVSATPPAEQQAPENRQIVVAVKALNESGMLGENRELAFVRDPRTQRPVIQVVDRTTREVISQIPPEYVLRLAEDSVSFKP
jgi:uncharacterized FlaG/YvyC family protein